MGRIFSLPVLNGLKSEVHFYPGFAVLVHQKTGDIVITRKTDAGLHEIGTKFAGTAAEVEFCESNLVEVPPLCADCGGVLCISAHASALMNLRLAQAPRAFSRQDRRPENSMPRLLHCMIAKGQKSNLGKSSGPESVRPVGPLGQLNANFYGPFPDEAIRRKKLFQVFICDVISCVWAVPVRHRSECVNVAKRLVAKIRAEQSVDLTGKVVHRLRPDNDKG
jgi:hypothetical protein